MNQVLFDPLHPSIDGRRRWTWAGDSLKRPGVESYDAASATLQPYMCLHVLHEDESLRNFAPCIVLDCANLQVTLFLPPVSGPWVPSWAAAQETRKYQRRAVRKLPEAQRLES